jgi:hypothetical protein
MAMPRLALISRSPVGSDTALTAARRVSAATRAPARSVSGSRIRNSSPP